MSKVSNHACYHLFQIFSSNMLQNKLLLSLIFQKISWERLTEPPPQTPPPFFLSRFALDSGFTFNSQALRAFDSNFALDSGLNCPQLSIGKLGLPLPKTQINSWIHPWLNSSPLQNFCLRPWYNPWRCLNDHLYNPYLKKIFSQSTIRLD